MVWIWIGMAWVVGAICGALILGRVIKRRDEQKPR